MGKVIIVQTGFKICYQEIFEPLHDEKICWNISALTAAIMSMIKIWTIQFEKSQSELGINLLHADIFKK